MDESQLSDGVWIVRTTEHSYGRSRVAKLCDLPDHPYDFASIICSQDDLCTFIGKFEKEYAEKNNGWSPSRFELSSEILLFLAEKAGHRKKRQKKLPSRRIDLTL